ncbi:MAG: hypothetical protein EBR82_16225 [Caulobacteraceae bacterium]|nr:hypothetical protein [Caulobacteraceae bacterium]
MTIRFSGPQAGGVFRMINNGGGGGGGAQGAQGAQGPQGFQGTQGSQGTNGAPDTTGAQYTGAKAGGSPLGSIVVLTSWLA